MTTIKFQVKIAYTHHVREFEFRTDTTIASLIENIKREAFDKFDPFIDRTQFNDVSVIESGQYNNINGVHPEAAPPLAPSSMTIREMYEGRYHQIAFYINPLPLYTFGH